jgi:glycosyltransferase involved in cell wall biosynthesis
VLGWGLERERVRCIPYGADLPDEEVEAGEARAWRAQLGARPDRPLWVCPLRLEASRGHDVLFEAAARLAERGRPGILALGAAGPRRAELEAKAEAMGLAASVRFLDGAEPVGALIAAADVAVFPVLEGPVPLTLLDALARARAVVASGVPAIADLLRDGVDARVVPPGDAEALAAAIEDLHRRPEVARRLGGEAAWRAREELSWGRVVESFEDVYDEVLGLASFAPGGVSSRAR